VDGKSASNSALFVDANKNERFTCCADLAGLLAARFHPATIKAASLCWNAWEYNSIDICIILLSNFNMSNDFMTTIVDDGSEAIAKLIGRHFSALASCDKFFCILLHYY